MMILPLVVLLSTPSLAEVSTPPARPHVLLIMTDDMGWSDLHCQAAHTQH
jgi:hypothetical protein